MKQFFGPTIKMFLLKAVVTIPIFFLATFLEFRSHMYQLDYYYVGFPFKYLEGGGMCGVDYPCPSQYHYLNLGLDILIWFLVSCLLITLISLLFKRNN